MIRVGCMGREEDSGSSLDLRTPFSVSFFMVFLDSVLIDWAVPYE